MSVIQDAIKQILDKPNDVSLRDTFKRYLKLHNFIAMPPSTTSADELEEIIVQAYIELVRIASKLNYAEQVEWEQPAVLREAMANLEQQSNLGYTEDTFIFELLQHLGVLSTTIRLQEQYASLDIGDALRAIDAIEILQIGLEVKGLDFDLHGKILQHFNNTEVEQ